MLSAFARLRKLDLAYRRSKIEIKYSFRSALLVLPTGRFCGWGKYVFISGLLCVCGRVRDIVVLCVDVYCVYKWGAFYV